MYLLTADLLRADHGPFEFLHPHSGAAWALRSGVIESDTMLTLQLARMQALSSMKSHPKLKPDDMAETLRALFFDACGAVPYITDGKSASAHVESDRARAFEKYREMLARLQKKDDTA